MNENVADPKPLVLGVDDLEDNLIILKRPLAKAGYTLITAQSGEEALQALADNEVDVILLDWMMPKMSGIKVLEEIRKRDEWRLIPVIMVTAKNSPEDVHTGLEAGASDYITKPYDRTELMARVSAAVREKALKTELKGANDELKKRNLFIRETFGRYQSDEIVNILLESADGLTMGGDKRIVTVMFTDLRGFATLSEKMAPETVVEMLNGYFEAMTNIVSLHSGVIIDFIGDALMVVFGAPLLGDDDARRAIACALDMQKAMDEVNRNNSRIGLPSLEMGIGINTGEVVAGNIGSSKRAKYGVIGSNVNLASRVEGFTVGCQILISETTMNDAGDGVMTGNSYSVSMKGIDKPVELYEVIGIDGNKMISSPGENSSMIDIQEPLSIRFTLLVNKISQGEEISGKIIKLSKKSAVMTFASPVSAMSNLKFRLADEGEENYFYGKTVEEFDKAPHTYLIYFTSVPAVIERRFAPLIETGA